MSDVSETSLLLGRNTRSTENDLAESKSAERTQRNSKRSVLVLMGCAALVAVGWNSRLRNDGGSPLNDSSKTIISDTQNLDTAAFDRVFHTWESNLYKRNQLVPLVGSAKRSSDTMIDDDNNDGSLIYLNHSKAFDMLRSTKASLTSDFYYYQQGWDAQINQAYCAVASSMAALNSLRGKITLPQDPVYAPFPWATQLTLIQTECVRDNLYDIDKMEHRFWGLGLEMATTLLNCQLQDEGYKATSYPVDPANATAHEIRSIFIHALKDEDSRLLINYDRGGITQGPMGHGHFSPIGAYNYEKDSFLIMDVAKYKHPPVWVPTSKLMGGIGSLDFCAMFTYPDHPFDVTYPMVEIARTLGCQAMYRGYILITKDDTL
jgi:hypothetical protein